MTERDPHHNRGEQAWIGQPNGSLVAELTHVPGGRAWDVGCGRGENAIWLAQMGWQVTAIDVSDVAIEEARHKASRAGVDVDWQTADFTTRQPTPGHYDLVLLSYPALRTETATTVLQALTSAVSEGGELFVIGHANVEPEIATAMGFDPADYISVDDIIAGIAGTFELQLDAIRDHPNPPPGAIHSSDRLLRAVRLSERDGQ